MENNNAKPRARKRPALPPPVMSMTELAKLGGGKIAYIKALTAEEAQSMLPTIAAIPAGTSLYALYAADGTPIALTDSRQAAVRHALGDALEVASLH